MARPSGCRSFRQLQAHEAKPHAPAPRLCRRPLKNASRQRAFLAPRHIDELELDRGSRASSSVSFPKGATHDCIIRSGPRRLRLSVIAVAGCTTTGIGTGQSANGGLGATFSWTETGGTRGTMVASLTNGQVFQGQFFQITQESRVTDYGPLWNGWGPGWGWGGGWGGRRWGYGWGGWGPWGPNNETITHYTGRSSPTCRVPAASCAAISRWQPGFRAWRAAASANASFRPA